MRQAEKAVGRLVSSVTLCIGASSGDPFGDGPGLVPGLLWPTPAGQAATMRRLTVSDHPNPNRFTDFLPGGRDVATSSRSAYPEALERSCQWIRNRMRDLRPQG